MPKESLIIVGALLVIGGLLGIIVAQGMYQEVLQNYPTHSLEQGSQLVKVGDFKAGCIWATIIGVILVLAGVGKQLKEQLKLTGMGEQLKKLHGRDSEGS